MLTLTYRENMTDRARMARDFDVFMKRIRRIFPGFEYVCVFEEQKRGAWHAHLAVQRVQSHYLHKGVLVKSYDLLRAVWRAGWVKGTSISRGLVGTPSATLRSSPRTSQSTCLKPSMRVVWGIAIGLAEKPFLSLSWCVVLLLTSGGLALICWVCFSSSTALEPFTLRTSTAAACTWR